MDEAEIRKLAGRGRIPIGTIEKDYALSLMLSILSNLEVSDKFVFKGGTEIKKMYYAEARFSEDLDFSYFDIDSEHIKEFILDIRNINPFKVLKLLEIKDESLKADSYSCRVNFLGPLNFKNSIKLDFSGGEKLIREMEYREIRDDYRSWNDCACRYLQHTRSQNYLGGIKYFYACEQRMANEIRSFESCWKYCKLYLPGAELQQRNGIITMNIVEILAEKCRALMMRSMPRDLYDICFLLEKGIKFEVAMVKNKLKRFREPWDKEDFDEKIEVLRPIWKRDLERLVPRVPDFDAVVKLVSSEIQF